MKVSTTAVLLGAFCLVSCAREHAVVQQVKSDAARTHAAHRSHSLRCEPCLKNPRVRGRAPGSQVT
jgi:PBP1b-binding outer membrane lipoprotein LpoB